MSKRNGKGKGKAADFGESRKAKPVDPELAGSLARETHVLATYEGGS